MGNKQKANAANAGGQTLLRPGGRRLEQTQKAPPRKEKRDGDHDGMKVPLQMHVNRPSLAIGDPLELWRLGSYPPVVISQVMPSLQYPTWKFEHLSFLSDGELFLHAGLVSSSPFLGLHCVLERLEESRAVAAREIGIGPAALSCLAQVA
jgi:hypothetical protein